MYFKILDESRFEVEVEMGDWMDWKKKFGEINNDMYQTDRAEREWTP